MEQRIEILEKRTNWLTAIVVIQAIALFLISTGERIETPVHASNAVQTFETIVANRIEVVSEKGKAVLASDGLMLFNASGSETTRLTSFGLLKILGRDGSSVNISAGLGAHISLSNEKRDNSALLSAGHTGASLHLVSKAQKSVAHLGADISGAMLNTYEYEGDASSARGIGASIGIDAHPTPGFERTTDREPFMRLVSKVGMGEAEASFKQGQGPYFHLSDTEFNPRVILSYQGGQPKVTILDQNSSERAVLGCTATQNNKGQTISCPESTLTLFDPDGKVLHQAP